MLRPSITRPKRRPRPGLEPVGQRGRPRGTSARWAKSRNSFRRALTATTRWSGEHTCSRWILQRRDRGVQGYAWLHFWGHTATLGLVTSRGLPMGHRGAYNRSVSLNLDLFRCCLTEQEMGKAHSNRVNHLIPIMFSINPEEVCGDVEKGVWRSTEGCRST